MDDYISRETAVKVLTSVGMQVSDSRRRAVAKCINEIELLHAADVEPVRHGRWIGLEYDGYADGNPIYDLWECSECGEEVRGESVPETHLFCHKCGAKMDGGAEDG